MKRIRMYSSEIPTPGDMNLIGDYSAQAFGELLQSITDMTECLLKDYTPVIALGANITITSAENQPFFVNDGTYMYFGTQAPFVDATTPAAVGPNAQVVGIFLIVSERVNPAAANRDYLTGSPVVRGPAMTDYSKEYYARYVLSVDAYVSGGAIPVPTPPVLGVNDLGYLLWATIVDDPTLATFTITQNTAVVWVFPGVASPVVGHGATHVAPPVGTGVGAQLIPVAAMPSAFGDPTGSDAGIMPAGDRFICSNAVQRVTSSTACLVVTITGDNLLAATPYVYDMALDYGAGLTLAAGSLVVDFFGTGAANTVAHSDHTHDDFTTLPFYDCEDTDTVDDTMLGTTFTVTVPAGPTVVHGMKVYWAPPGVTYPRFECSWFSTSTNGSVGVNFYKTAANTMDASYGTKAYCFLDATALAVAIAAAGGSVTWSYDTTYNYPTSGELYFEFLGTIPV